MPVPLEDINAGVQFRQVFSDARDYAGLVTVNQSYTMVQGVLLVFRRRLDVHDALHFAAALPPVTRAMFVARWNLDEPVAAFVERYEMTLEVQALRPLHNYAPDTCISNVAAALRRNCDQRALDRCLATLGPKAVAYWTPTPGDRDRHDLDHPFPGPLPLAPTRGPGYPAC